MAPFTSAAPKLIAEARRLYETDHLPASEIAARVGLSTSTISRYAKAQGWSKTAKKKAAKKTPAKKAATKIARKVGETPRAATKSGRGGRGREASTKKELATPAAAVETSAPSPIQVDASPSARIALAVSRAIGAAEKQLEDIERRLGVVSRDAATRERDARTFSIVSRALRDLVATSLAMNPDASAAAEDGVDDIETQDAEPQDLEALAALYRERITRALAEVSEGGRADEPAADGHAAAPGGGTDEPLALPGADGPARA